MRKSLILLFLTIAGTASAQVTGVLKEAVGDQPVAGATVFINRTSVSSSTDENGAFLLDGLMPGFMELVISKPGYQMFRSPIRLQEGKAFKLNLKLTKLDNAVAPGTPDPTGLAGFVSEVVGTSYAASVGKIVNPKTLQFSGGNVALAEPLVYENSISGYRVSCYLGSPVAIEEFLQKAAFKFDTLVPKNSKQLDEWRAGRQKQYLGSRAHFYWSLVNNRSIEQGFELAYENGVPVNVDSLMKPSKIAGYAKIILPPKMEVRYRGIREGDAIPVSAFASAGPFDVNAAGVSFNDGGVAITGTMNVKLAEQLPANYFPIDMLVGLDKARQTMLLFQEKMFIHTDKPYYYAGQAMWFKAYMNTYQRNLRDSLSKVLYVELIAPDRSILLSRMLRIENGEANGDWVLPDTLKRGNYYLRGYTSLMRNFGDDALFVRAVPVLTILDRTADTGSAKHSLTEGLSVSTAKTIYKPHEKVDVQIKLTDKSGAPLKGSFSVSVLDVNQVVTAKEPSIVNDLGFAEEAHKFSPVALKIPVETGITIEGQFYNDKGKKAKTSVTILQGKFEDVNTIETDDEGRFALSGLDFYDSASFRIQAKNPKGKIIGKVELVKRQIPETDFPDAGEVQFIQTNEPQRVISDYEVPYSVRQLEQVDIIARRVVASTFVAQTYGNPTRIISGEKLFGSDMLSSLLATVPGLKVNYISNAQPGQPSQTLTFQRMGSKVPSASLEPLIYVDETLRGGGSNVVNQVGPGAVEALTSINPSNVDHVEVISSKNGRIAVEQGDGLIAIFMKAGYGQRKSFDIFKIPGFNKPRTFTSPNYEKEPDSKLKDARATLLWKPDLHIENGAADISFFAADDPATYKIIVQGVTSNGDPVYSEHNVKVSK